MALVDYSGSESDSGNEEELTTPEPTKPRSTSNKPAFQKVVDRSNPHKIKVSLPETARASTEDGDVDQEPPTKRAKIGTGGTGGFNSFLPAPKRTAAPNAGSSIGGIRRGVLGSGVNLKTGATPAFSREPAPNVDESTSEDGIDQSGSAVESTGPDAAPSSTEKRPDKPTPEVGVESKKKSTIFKPLSVANKKATKKKVSPADSLRPPELTTGGLTQPTKGATKPSLFSTGDEPIEAENNGSAIKGAYQPMIYHSEKPKIVPPTNPYSEESTPIQDYATADSTDPQGQAPESQPQSLDAIANDLNLSASAKRQLLGRNHNGNKAHPSQLPTVPNIVNFNTDEEYAANELFRQAGETVQHNPVRGIAPGKHSLRQLVNAASNQKDALEESFASGRRNKKEAGSKYG